MSMSEPNGSDTSALLLQILSLQAELTNLQCRYDALLASKERAASRYKADYKKWRTFKLWLCKNSNCDKEMLSMMNDTDCGIDQTFPGINKRRRLDGKRPLLAAFDHAEEQLSNKLALTPPDVPSKQHTVSPSAHALRYQAVSAKTAMPSSSKPLRPVQSVVKGILNEELAAGTTASQSTDLPREKRGRYAQANNSVTINSRFVICKERNHGLDYQYDDVVKSREERKMMLADDCECCRDYYEAVGPLPKPPQQLLWRSPSSTPTKKRRFSFDSPSDCKENREDIEHHKEQISRHRHHWYRAKTPPGYWDIGFPDTQETSDINRRAALMYARKLVEVESEARSGKGRYVART